MAGKYDIVIEQGATFTRVITWKDSTGAVVNLTGKTAKMSIKDPKGTVILTLTDASGITLGGAAGTITITITPAQTAAFTFDFAKYDLDIVTSTTDIKRLLQGTVTLSPEVTL